MQSTLLHAADIANPAKPVVLSSQWTALLTEEFYLQGDEELRLGLPISPLCDRNAGHFARSQVGFINFIVQPTFALLAQVSQHVETAIMPHLHENLAFWERRRVEEEEEELALQGGAAVGGG
uniref:PDEase domain-containing protein n=1 Tax=Alexandrium andersonii TaxID=327968 RepID=A0A7S2CWU0_9DINO